MCKKLVSICLALIMASVSFGDYTVVVGNWEGAMDGWSVNGGESPVYDSDYGVTLDTFSLGLWQEAPTADNFDWSLYNGSMWGYYPDLVQHGATFQIDVTWVASEWSADLEDVWAQCELLAINTGGGLNWQQFQCIDPVNTAYPGSWDPYNWTPDPHTRTLTWDLDQYNLGQAMGAWWMQFSISTNWGGTNVSPGAYYFDNARIVVPEPATIALLGLGGLALIRRKK